MSVEALLSEIPPQGVPLHLLLSSPFENVELVVIRAAEQGKVRLNEDDKVVISDGMMVDDSEKELNKTFMKSKMVLLHLYAMLSRMHNMKVDEALDNYEWIVNSVGVKWEQLSKWGKFSRTDVIRAGMSGLVSVALDQEGWIVNVKMIAMPFIITTFKELQAEAAKNNAANTSIRRLEGGKVPKEFDDSVSVITEEEEFEEPKLNEKVVLFKELLSTLVDGPHKYSPRILATHLLSNSALMMKAQELGYSKSLLFLQDAMAHGYLDGKLENNLWYAMKPSSGTLLDAGVFDILVKCLSVATKKKQKWIKLSSFGSEFGKPVMSEANKKGYKNLKVFIIDAIVNHAISGFFNVEENEWVVSTPGNVFEYPRDISFTQTSVSSDNPISVIEIVDENMNQNKNENKSNIQERLPNDPNRFVEFLNWLMPRLTSQSPTIRLYVLGSTLPINLQKIVSSYGYSKFQRYVFDMMVCGYLSGNVIGNDWELYRPGTKTMDIARYKPLVDLLTDLPLPLSKFGGSPKGNSLSIHWRSDYPSLMFYCVEAAAHKAISMESINGGTDWHIWLRRNEKVESNLNGKAETQRNTEPLPPVEPLSNRRVVSQPNDPRRAIKNPRRDLFLEVSQRLHSLNYEQDDGLLVLVKIKEIFDIHTSRN